MKLALKNLLHDRVRFIVTVIGIAFAVFLMVFQGSLLTGFLRAASKGIDLTDGEIWVAARGVDCFEFATPLPERFREMVMGVSGVDSVRRITLGFVQWKKPSGLSQVVLLIGADPKIGARFPVPYLGSNLAVVRPESIVVDQSNHDSLETAILPVELEVNQRRARVVEATNSFGSFFGTPYVFTGYQDAVGYLRLSAEQTHFLVVQVAPGRDIPSVLQRLRERLPEADVWKRDAFSNHARLFWVSKTGAGGAILMAALLGFLVGLVIVSQNIYATTMENLEEFATLKAMGATRGYIRRVVIWQALTSGLVGSLLGVSATYPAINAARGGISWIHTPWWLPAGTVVVGLLMCALASVISVRKALSVEPARVFRA